MKNMEIINEAAIFIGHPCPSCCQVITWEDLKKSKVGDCWVQDQQDAFPERNTVWEEKFTVIHKTDSGVAILHESDRSGEWETISLNWYEFAHKIKEDEMKETAFWLSAIKDAEKSISDDNLGLFLDEYIAERRKRAAEAILKFYSSAATGEYKD